MKSENANYIIGRGYNGCGVCALCVTVFYTHDKHCISITVIKNDYCFFNSSLIYLADCLHANYEQLILGLVGMYSHTWTRPDPGSCKYCFTVRCELYYNF